MVRFGLDDDKLTLQIRLLTELKANLFLCGNYVENYIRQVVSIFKNRYQNVEFQFMNCDGAWRQNHSGKYLLPV